MPEFEPPYTGPSGFELDHGSTAYVLVRVRTAVNERNAGLLRSMIATVFREDRHFIAVDLTDGAVYGPQGYGPLIGAVKTCRDRGGELYLIGASPTVVGVLGHDTRGPVRSYGSRHELDRALLGCSPAIEAVGGGS